MKPYYQDKWVTIYNGDCREVSLHGISAVVTDPPYELGFMGKTWDSQGVSFQKETWEIIRKMCLPGSPLLSFGGSRTQHRIACAIEDAGWEIRDTLMWVYGSGFPKSLDIGKAVDKLNGAEREVIGRIDVGHDITGGGYKDAKPERKIMDITKGQSVWEGYGTGLKPAYEPIILAMNPPDGTFANNALRYGVAGLNIDGCRVHGEKGNGVWGTSNATINTDRKFNASPDMQEYRSQQHPQGRFPANFLHDGSQAVMELFPETKSGGAPVPGTHRTRANTYGNPTISLTRSHGSNSGSAARFFYCAKSSKRERGEGNNHATVKPLALMEYLVKLVTMPEYNLILDPFAGSGTTLLACSRLGIPCIGVESEKKYCEIAAKRCSQLKREEYNEQT